jgi:hypothetical protein
MFKQTMSEYRFCRGATESQGDVWSFFDTLRYFLTTLKQYILFQYCKRFGHKFSCETIANAETGSDTFECSRCGYTREHIYY